MNQGSCAEKEVVSAGRADPMPFVGTKAEIVKLHL